MSDKKLLRSQYKQTWLFKVAKASGWIVFTIVLCVAGVLIGVVNMLTPERLTPLTLQMANRMLDADVTIDKVELSLRKSFPFLNLDIDRLVVESHDIKRMDIAARDTLPQWADTLFAADHLHGGINVFKIAAGVIDLKDLEIESPQLNILVVNDSLNNFSIVPSSPDEKDSTSVTVPDIRLNRFRLITPNPVRYSDLAQRVSINAEIQSADLTNKAYAQSTLPEYRVDFASNISSPLLQMIGQEALPVSFDGIVEWRHEYPLRIILKDFGFAVSRISGAVNIVLDFSDLLTVESFDFKVDPLAVTDVLDLIPDSLATCYDIPKDIQTDAKVSMSGRFNKPFVIGNTSLPDADISMSLLPSYMKWEMLDIKDMMSDIQVLLRGGSADDVVVQIDKLKVCGPATKIEIEGKLANLESDPLFDGEIDGDIVIDDLPGIIRDRLGATLKGLFTAHTSVIASASMLSRDGFHKLRLAGDARVDDFYYLADDTLTMYYLHKTDLKFGTNERFANGRGVAADSLLKATLQVDSADMLVSGLDMRVKKLKLGVGAQNVKASADTTIIIPMGGGLSVGDFSLFSISDSAGVRLHNVNGRVSMKRYNDDAHLPLFDLNLGIGAISAGNNSTRFMLNKGVLSCKMAKLPIDQLTESRRHVRHLADSISHLHPELPVDSVYVMALKIRNRNRRPGHHRVHPEITAQENEIIDWGTSTALKRLLLDWDIKGSLKAEAARLFTSSFPVRNRVENFNIHFNNDSLSMSEIKYKAGRSDFLLSGNVTNMVKAFTSKRQQSPLRMNFNIVSKFIDINEISHAFFTGAAHSDAKIGDEHSKEDDLDRALDANRHEHGDSIAALLIPTNIDAELKVRADEVEYSDFLLKGFEGTLLMYDGALNLHDLKAASDVGSIDLSALYSAHTRDDINFGFGMKLKDFNISNFIKLVPAVDTIMPMLRDLSGIVSANLALTTEINRNMDLILPSVKAAININGDSVAFIDSVTFRKVAKWLLFRDKEKNMIDHISAEMIVDNGEMRIFPFIFDFDRYRLGVQGYNDFDMNFNYHIAVLKSPIPFKFGINIKGNYDKLKIRLGGAKFNEKTPLDRAPIVDKTRVNLLNQFQEVFRRGVRNSKFATVDISSKPLAEEINLDTDTLTAADSVYFRDQGLIPE